MHLVCSAPPPASTLLPNGTFRRVPCVTSIGQWHPSCGTIWSGSPVLDMDSWWSSRSSTCKVVPKQLGAIPHGVGPRCTGVGFACQPSGRILGSLAHAISPPDLSLTQPGWATSKMALSSSAALHLDVWTPFQMCAVRAATWLRLHGRTYSVFLFVRSCMFTHVLISQ